MNEPIFYLAQIYTHHPLGPESAFQQALEWCDTLEREYGLDVYSPIAESHPKWIWMQENIDKSVYPKHRYWLEKDFAKIRGFMDNNGIPVNSILEMYDSGIVMLMDDNALIDVDNQKYGGLNALYQSWKEGLIEYQDWESFWLSSGCKQEYEFAKSNHIRVLSLQKVLLILEKLDKYTLADILNYAKKNNIEVEL